MTGALIGQSRADAGFDIRVATAIQVADDFSFALGSDTDFGDGDGCCGTFGPPSPRRSLIRLCDLR